jgi:hypothetical protein
MTCPETGEIYLKWLDQTISDLTSVAILAQVEDELSIESCEFGVVMASSSSGGGPSAAGASSSSSANSSSAPQFSIVKPQEQYVVFTDSPGPEIVHSYLYNTATLEIKLLGVGVWEIDVDEQSGLAVVYDPEENKSWAVDHLELVLYKDASNREVLYRKQESMGFLAVVKHKHIIIEAPLLVIDVGSEISVNCAVFAFDQYPGRLFVNVIDFWTKMGFRFAPRSGARWFQTRQARWRRLASLFDLGDFAVRGSLPYKNAMRTMRSQIPKGA